MARPEGSVGLVVAVNYYGAIGIEAYLVNILPNLKSS